MAKMVDAIIDLPNMVSIRVAEPWGKNGSSGSIPGSPTKLFVDSF